MGRMVFLNLPVADVRVSRRFWTALGFAVDERFSDAQTLSVVLEQGSTSLMLLEHDRFREFITNDVADPRVATQVLTCLSCDSREEVDGLLAGALAAGGSPWLPTTDSGPMYGASFADPDGHVWELVHMDLSALPVQHGAAPEPVVG